MSTPLIILFAIQYLLIILFIILLAYIGYVMISFKNVVPYVPTPKKVIKMMVELADIRDYEKICDLGSGTGRIIIQIAKAHPKNLIVGIERAFVPRTISKIRLLFHPILRRRIQIVKRDFFNTDLVNFNVAFCFLTPKAMRLLYSQFKAMRQGSRVVSYMFHFEEFAGFEEHVHHLNAKQSVYLYKRQVH